MPLNPFQRAKRRPKTLPLPLPSLLLSNLITLTRNSPILINNAPKLQGSEVPKIPTLP